MHHYARLAAMTLLSFVAMFILMYAMVNTYDDVFANINQGYMAALMAAPMVVIEVALMGAMYQHKTANIAVISISVAILVLSFAAIRFQTAVGDRHFVRSMIPHHSGAILMCRGAKIYDAELKELCNRIIKSQADEIAQMKQILSRLNR